MKKGLVTGIIGHTGFKGSWFSIWLKELGRLVLGTFDTGIGDLINEC